MRLPLAPLLAPALALSLTLAGAPLLAGTDTAGRISVTGEGVVTAAPDMAEISVAVTTEAETAAEALTQNSARLEAVLAQLRAAGIEARDMQTEGLGVSPVWGGDGDETGPAITGYSAHNGVKVRVRDLSKLGAVLDAAVADGANSLGGLRFGVSNEAQLMDEARRAAVAQARARAELLAGAAGAQLGAILSISEQGGMAPYPMPMLKAGLVAAPAPVPMQGGELGLSASVTIDWQLQQ